MSISHSPAKRSGSIPTPASENNDLAQVINNLRRLKASQDVTFAYAKLAKQATARMHEFTEKYCTIAVPGRESFRRAVELAGNDALKLRAGDALHLAIAESLNAQVILCLDDAMTESAKLLGMAVARG
jgi:predicted nucleic acid-binding protein